ncbi:hypothetical protein N8T08_001670 [Aspergillus melleus]|uniref:Uncharacterized protein n=1 Tax=Aspergillus melleus TaxID=138277 RepID=A0ACC3AMY8_9EURO|nr:hypothetical protein N8T08_001670 [Aspergillus melleus]
MPVQTPTSQDDVMEKGIQECYPPLPSLDYQNDDFQPHRGTPSPSVHGVNQNQSFTSEYRLYDLPARASSEPDVLIKEESFDPNDPTIGLFHPVPRPASLFIASRNMAMFPDAFADAKMEFDSTSLFASPEASNECFFGDSVSRRPEWTIDDVGSTPLLNELSPGRPIDTFMDTGLASMNDTCSPDSSLSWSSLGYETNLGMQQPQPQQALVNRNDVLCSNGPELFTPSDHYDHINAGYDQTVTIATTANDFHGLNSLELLNKCKRRGLSYKDIKRLGGFKEAESTLRGETALRSRKRLFGNRQGLPPLTQL